jgi:hypothetical protein
VGGLQNFDPPGRLPPSQTRAHGLSQQRGGATSTGPPPSRLTQVPPSAARPAQQSALSAVGRRLDRAEEHLATLGRALQAWRDQNPSPILGRGNPEKTRHDFYASFEVQPDLVGWGIVFGDAIHNLRAALDNLVWECASRDGPPPKQTEFPVFVDRDRYFAPQKDRGGGQWKMSGIRNEAVRRAIEQVQPWSCAKPPEHDPLWVIHEFNNADKHRVITPVLLVPRTLETSISLEYADEATAGDSVPPAIEYWDGPIEDGRRVFTIHTPSRPEKVAMSHGVTLGVAISLGDRTGGITGTLGSLCSHVRGVVERVVAVLPT